MIRNYEFILSYHEAQRMRLIDMSKRHGQIMFSCSVKLHSFWWKFPVKVKLIRYLPLTSDDFIIILL